MVSDLHDTLMDFRQRYGAGRAIAAPQIGLMKRLIYMHIDRPMVFINPELDKKGIETIDVWDDCLCFPDLLVRVRRHRTCRIQYRNPDWIEEEMALEDDLSEYNNDKYICQAIESVIDQTFQWVGVRHCL